MGLPKLKRPGFATGSPIIKARITRKNLHPQFHQITRLCFDRCILAVPTVLQPAFGFEGSIVRLILVALAGHQHQKQSSQKWFAKID
jgi:hypothetical protein